MITAPYKFTYLLTYLQIWHSSQQRCSADRIVLLIVILMSKTHSMWLLVYWKASNCLNGSSCNAGANSTQVQAVSDDRDSC